MAPPPPLSLKARALRWLAQREHTRAELGRKLRSVQQRSESGASSDDGALGADIEPLLDELEAKGFLSDQRAAESLLAGRGSRLGPLRLRQLLQAKGVEPDLLHSTLARSREGELDRARAAWQSKFDAAAADPRERARQARFLAARGFSAEVISRVLRGGDLTE